MGEVNDELSAYQECAHPCRCTTEKASQAVLIDDVKVWVSYCHNLVVHIVDTSEILDIALSLFNHVSVT